MNRITALAVFLAGFLLCGCESQQQRLEREDRENRLTGEFDSLFVELSAISSEWESENPAPLEDAGELAAWETERLGHLRKEHGDLYRRYEELKNELGIEKTDLDR